MSQFEYKRYEPISLRSDARFNEAWVQNIICEDPSILGLGDLILKDRERLQPKAGRLDLLLQDSELGHRYEAELQLGKTDETHIIRTLEYWDIERKRYPQYEHTAVLIAEDITSRFLNVISLFNGVIPIVAIQMNAIQVGNSVCLVFTKVLDQMTLGLVDEDEEQEATDRQFWETKRGTKATVAMADKILALIQEFDPGIQLSYRKHYIGLQKDGLSNNFAKLRPQRAALRIQIRLPKSDEVEHKITDSGLDLTDYSRWGTYRLRLLQGDIEKHKDLLRDLLEQAYREADS